MPNLSGINNLFEKLLFLKTLQGQDGFIYQLTLGYLAFLAIIFIYFSLIYFGPIIRRWIHLKTNVWFVSGQIKKSDDLTETRKQIQFKIFEKIGWAKEHYNSFRVTWEDARLRGGNKAASPIRLSEFLTPEIVVDEIVNRRVANALPGIFVALGIFGTFLGLVLGLEGLKLDEFANLKQGVGQLVSGLSLAFLTSLAGIFLSIIFSLSYRLLLRRLERALLRLDGLVAQIFPYHTTEHYIRKHIELQSDIKQSIQTLATDVATKITGTIGPAIEESLTKNLVPIIQDLQTKIKESIEESKKQQLQILGGFSEQVVKMSAAITGHFENSQQKQSEAMEGVLGQYVEYMNEAFKTQFQDMGRIIEETTKAQVDIKAQMVQFVEQLQKQFKVQSDLIDKTSRAAEILSESLESLENISQGFKSSADDIASAASLLEESAAKAMEGQEILRDSMEIQIKSMITTREELEQAWKTIIENTDSTVQLIREVIRELAEGVGDQLNNALIAFDGKVAEVVERFSGTLFEMNQTIEELPGLLSNINETFDSVHTEISAHKDILRELRSTTENIVAPNIEKAAEASQNLHQTSEHITTSVNDLKNWSDELFEKVNQNIKIFEKEGPLYTALSQIDTNLVKIAQQPELINDAISGAVKELNISLDIIKKRIEKVIDGDGGISGELLQDIKRIANQATSVSVKIENDLIADLKSINESTKKMVVDFDKFRKTTGSGEVKKGFFSRIIKK
ncbi:MAG: MotA/TolQ/ExbB proton channel family protein [Desulfobacteraceae bacterium]|nr:MotA/TolQ/ExbB proton channel family protein [Desulfobacteraceae bacterium]